MDVTDFQLVELARSGDRQAFSRLVDRHAPRLYQLATIMTGNFNDAQDLVQETLIGAYEGLGQFQGRSAVKTWLTGILIRQSAMQRRKNARSRAMNSLDHPQALEVEDGRRATSHWVDRVDSRLDLMGFLAKLSPEHREVVVLRELEGLSYEQIAQMTGLPQGTVESRLFRAREALRQVVADSAVPSSADKKSDSPTSQGGV